MLDGDGKALKSDGEEFKGDAWYAFKREEKGVEGDGEALNDDEKALKGGNKEVKDDEMH